MSEKEISKLKELLKKGITMGQKAFVLECLELILDDRSLDERRVLIAHQFNRLKAEKGQGTLSKEEISLNTNKITSRLVQLVNDINFENIKSTERKVISGLISIWQHKQGKPRLTKRLPLISFASLIISVLLFVAGMAFGNNFISGKPTSPQLAVDSPQRDSLAQVIRQLHQENDSLVLSNDSMASFSEELNSTNQGLSAQIKRLNNRVQLSVAGSERQQSSIDSLSSLLNSIEVDLDRCKRQVLPTPEHAKVFFHHEEGNAKVGKIESSLRRAGIEFGDPHYMAPPAGYREVTIECRANDKTARRTALYILSKIEDQEFCVQGNHLIESSNEIHIYVK